MPHGIVEYRKKKFVVPLQQTQLQKTSIRDSFHKERIARIKQAFTTADAGQKPQLIPLNHESLVAFLEARGIPRHHLVEGSIPADSLSFMAKVLTDQLPKDRPLKAIHIGNFVGVSLTYLTAVLTSLHPSSRVVGIDPNLPHRGVIDPQAHVAALLSASALQKNVLLIAGYSSSKSISNDGVVFDGYDPSVQLASESGCEECVSSLAHIAHGKFDLVLMDGNHEAEYLKGEILNSAKMLRKGGLIVLDDVDVNWQELKDVFGQIKSMGFTSLGTDGRIGIARLDESQDS